MDTPKISIVIPVYNDGRFVKDCIESILVQSFKDFEVIFVNDGSTDDSLAILNKYAETDERIIVVDKKQNEGTMLARKSGTDITRGSYVTYVDSDDIIDEEFLYYINESIEKYHCDILHFNLATQDFLYNNGKIVRKESMCPIDKHLKTTEEHLKYTFEERAIATSLAGKAFKRDLCIKAFAELPYERNHVGEDVFSYFIISCFAQSYKGVVGIDKDFYIYRYGLGVSGTENMPLSKYEYYCKMSQWVKYAEEFLDRTNASKEKRQACKYMARRMFLDCCSIYRRRISEENQYAASVMLSKYWKNADIDNDAWLNGVYENKERFLAKYGDYTVIKDSNCKDAKISIVVTVSSKTENFEKCLTDILLHNSEYSEVVIVAEDDINVPVTLLKYNVKIVKYPFGDAAARRNAGIDNAKGEYIIFVDANDYIYSDVLEKLYNTAAENNLDVIFFEHKEYCENNKNDTSCTVSDKYNICTGMDLLHLAYIRNNHKNSCYGQMIKLSCLKENNIRFITGISKEEDVFVPILMLKADRVIKISDVVYQYRKVEKSKNLFKEFESHFIIYNKLLAEYISSGYVFEPLLMLAEREYNICLRIHRKFSKAEKMEIIDKLPVDYRLIFEKTSFDHKKPGAVARFVQCTKDQGIRYSIDLLVSMIKNR